MDALSPAFSATLADFYRRRDWANFHSTPDGPITPNDSVRLATIASHSAEPEPQWFWLVLVTMPITCIVGNTLVVAAVLSNKALQTPTNYLLVSLACADLMVGTLVAPFHIYMTINSLHWHLPALACYVYCVLDVLASTSSIIHLLLISMDRLVAATKPAEYKSHKHKKRVYLAIGFCWLFSTFLSLPLVLGFNSDAGQYLVEEHHCGIYSPGYMFGSSIFAFFLPLFLMSLIYGYIFYTLKRRLRAIQLQEMAGGQFLGFGADLGNIATSAMETVIGVEQKNRNMITWEKPLLKKIEETAAEHASSLNESEREQLQNILQANSSSGNSLSVIEERATEREESCRVTQTTSSGTKKKGVSIVERDDISQGYASSIVLDAITADPPCFKEQKVEGACHLLEVPNLLGASSANMLLEVPCGRLPGRRHSEHVQRRISTISSTFLAVDSGCDVLDQRRLSLQSPGEKRRNRHRLNSLKPPPNRIGNKKSMRRLSELITGWERPSRASLGQLLTFARRDSVYIARKKLAGLKDWALDLIAKLKSKQGMAIRREARATKLVATVMGVFLVCWAPFFSMNLYKIYHLYTGGWAHESEFTFHWLSALGYLNSSLNFFIYSAINKKFRTTFWRLLGLRRSNRRKSWMLPPPKQKSRRQKTENGRVATDTEENHKLNGAGSLSLISTIGDANGTAGVKSIVKSPKKKQKKVRVKREKGEKADEGGSGGGVSPAGTGGKARRRRRIVSLIPLSRHLSIRKPQIVIEDLANMNKNNSVSISAGGETTFRRSSDDCIQRSCSEVFGGGIVFPSGTHHNSRRGSAMSNSSASLQLHDIHQIEAQSAEEMAEAEIRAEIFV